MTYKLSILCTHNLFQEQVFAKEEGYEYERSAGGCFGGIGFFCSLIVVVTT